MLHSAFYRFTPLVDPAAAAATLRTLAAGPCSGLLGSVVVATEGVNGGVAGDADLVARFEAALQGADVMDGGLRGMRFQHSACSTVPFGRFKVGVKPEIVALDLPARGSLEDATSPPPPTPPNADPRDSSHLSPSAWRTLLSRDDVVLLDNRNHFEYRLGHFRGAVDPRVGNFRDLVAHVWTQAPAWRAARRPVAMYCTGGVRCDKTAPWLRSLGLEVWQLDGGILNFFRQVTADASASVDAQAEWQGECFVFDRRIALDSRLRETATTAEQVFDASRPDEAWRLARAQRLAAATQG